jgi:hypothetical protein
VHSQAELNCATFAAGVLKVSGSAAARTGDLQNSGLLRVRGQMSHPFTHPKGKELLKRVAQQFSGTGTYILRDSNIVFVCGGTNDDDMRPRFREYARVEIPHLRIFLAEDAQKDFVTHSEPQFHNIGEFEDIIGEVSDCIVLFPESPGSFAELAISQEMIDLERNYSLSTIWVCRARTVLSPWGQST